MLANALRLTSKGNPWYRAGGSPLPTAAWQAAGAASYAESLVNRANPGTYDAFEGVAPSWSSSGWQGNGTSAYLRTGLVVSSLSSTMIVRSSGAVTAIVAEIGAYQATGAKYAGLQYQTTNLAAVLLGTTGSSKTTTAASAGILAVAGNTMYFNGASAGTFTQVGSTPSIELYLLGRNTDGILARPTDHLVQAAAVWNGTILSAAQILAISTAMAAL